MNRFISKIRGHSIGICGTQFLKRMRVGLVEAISEASLKQVRILKELEKFAKIDKRNFFFITLHTVPFQASVLNRC